MRTKTLLIAVAALATGVLASRADNVYSANVVGYANIQTANAATYLMTVPFSIGVSNGANEIWPLSGGNPTIPDGSTLLVWNGSGYDNYLSDSSSSSLWDDAGGNPLSGAPRLPVGKGFFLIPAGNTTNTFVGSIAVSAGSSNVVSFANAVTYLVGGAVPYGGSVTNGNSITGAGGLGLSSLNGLPDGSTLLIWNGSGYDNYLSDSSSSSLWDDAGGNPLPSAPSISVGQGFFIIPAGDFSWKVGL